MVLAAFWATASVTANGAEVASPPAERERWTLRWHVAVVPAQAKPARRERMKRGTPPHDTRGFEIRAALLQWGGLGGRAVAGEVEFHEHEALSAGLRRREGPFLRGVEGQALEVAARAALFRERGEASTGVFAEDAPRDADVATNAATGTQRNVGDDCVDFR